MTTFKATLLLVFSFLILISCKSPKETDDLSTLSEEIIMKKNPCFGKCPAYILTIYKGGIASFDGKQFVKKYGLFTKKLSKSEYKSIKKAFKKADFWSFDDNYPSNIHDLPKTRLTYIHKDKSKTVTGDINRPQQVKDLEKTLVDLANSEGWTVRSVPDLDLPDYYIKDELIVGLNKNTDIKDWVQKYNAWNLQVVEAITPSRNLWLLKYDKTTIKPSQVMNDLALDENVLVLEFNKKVEDNMKRED